MTPEALTRLLEIADELKALDPGDLAARHRLNSEADELRALPAEASRDPDTARRWAERAGRKGTHAEDVEANRASIVSPSEGGGAGI